MTTSHHHLSPDDLARRWGVAVDTLRNWRSAGRGPSYLKLGGRVAYRLSDVEAWERGRIVVVDDLAPVVGGAA